MFRAEFNKRLGGLGRFKELCNYLFLIRSEALSTLVLSSEVMLILRPKNLKPIHQKNRRNLKPEPKLYCSNFINFENTTGAQKTFTV